MVVAWLFQTLGGGEGTRPASPRLLGYSVPEKSKLKWGGCGLRLIYTFLKKLSWIFKFVTLPLEILEKRRFHSPLEICKIAWNSKIKEDPWKFHISFCISWNTPGNSTSFLIDPWNFHIFLQYPYLEIPCPQLPYTMCCLDFFWKINNPFRQSSY